MTAELNFDNIPPEMRDRPQWVVWRFKHNPKRPNKPKKLPFDAKTRRAASVDKPETFSHYATAVDSYRRGGFNGIGYMFTRDDGFTGIDIDGCIQEDGTLLPRAVAIINMLDSYTEVSQSGTGIHIVVRGKVAEGLTKHREKDNIFEIYDQGRYFAMTGNAYPDGSLAKPIADRTALLPAALDVMFPSPKVKERLTAPPVESTPPVEVLSELDDVKLFEVIRQSATGHDFDALYSGGASESDDHSACDLALCNHLAFWTGKNVSRMDRLFRGSALMREKWDERRGNQTYGEMTIAKAIADTRNVFGDKPRKKNAPGGALTAHADPEHLSYDEVSISESEEKGNDVFNEPEFIELASRFERRFVVVNGGLCEVVFGQAGKPNPPKALCDIAPIIVRETLKDDGVQTRRYLELKALSREGILPKREVFADDFQNMNWLMRAWGAIANLQPGQAVKDKVRRAVQSTIRYAELRTVYTHLGWREVDGKMAYFHAGGAIGADNVLIELEKGLHRYTLPSPSYEEIQAGVNYSMMFSMLFPSSVSIPLLATVYLAPLKQFCNDNIPGYALFLRGTTGTGKSTLTAASLSHFGHFPNGKTAPASFNDTSNALRRKAFLLKDAVLWVDDFKPVADLRTKRMMNTAAQDLIRAYGDGHSRSRLNQQAETQSAEPPRGLCIITGEQEPDVGESGIARLWLVDVTASECPHTEETRDYLSNTGKLAAAGAGYVQWLAKQADKLPSLINERYAQLHKKLMGRSYSHARQPETATWLMVGWSFALDFWAAHTGINREYWMETAFNDLCKTIEVQKQQVAEEKPPKIFISTLRELVAAGRAAIIERPQNQIGEFVYSQYDRNRDAVIGYADDDYIYLFGRIAYATVERHMRDEGRTFPVNTPTLWKQMVEANMIRPDNNQPTRKKTIKFADGTKTSERYIWLHRSVWDAELEENA